MTPDIIRTSKEYTKYAHCAATMSGCGKYRYDLERWWDKTLAPCVWVMLNPSTADALEDDPTIRRCLGFTHRWGSFGGIVVVNLFAFRATDPDALPFADGWYDGGGGYREGSAVGPLNGEYLMKWATVAGRVVCAWGAHKRVRDEGKKTAKFLRLLNANVFHLGLTKDGHPRHPLYLSAETMLTIWREDHEAVLSRNPPAEVHGEPVWTPVRVGNPPSAGAAPPAGAE